jgi:hypothetical protein
MNSVVQSKNKLSRHKTPSRRMAANAGQSRAAINAGEAGETSSEHLRGKLYSRLLGRTWPPAHRNGKLERHPTGRAGRLDVEPERIRRNWSTWVAIHALARGTLQTSRGQSVMVGVWNASEPSRPPLSRRSSGTQWLQSAYNNPLEVDDVDAYGDEGGTDAGNPAARPAVYWRLAQRSRSRSWATGSGTREFADDIA